MPSRLDHSLVHCTAGCKRADFAMLGQDDLEAVGEMRQPRGVLERSAHHAGVLHTHTIVGEHAHTAAHQLCHRSERFAIAIDGDRRRRHHLTESVDAEIMDLTTTAALSIVGVVLGITTTAVNPPSAAPREPVWMVSASSPPGSRKCT